MCNFAEGAENFKKVATDKRSLADVTAMVKKANNKLHELQVDSFPFLIIQSNCKSNRIGRHGQRINRDSIEFKSIPNKVGPLKRDL